MKRLLLAALLLPATATAQTLSVPAETFTLPNGLTVKYGTVRVVDAEGNPTH